MIKIILMLNVGFSAYLFLNTFLSNPITPLTKLICSGIGVIEGCVVLAIVIIDESVKRESKKIQSEIK